MTTAPTRGALRAVNALNKANGNGYEMLISSESAAQIIDRETAASEMLGALQALMEYVPRFFAAAPSGSGRTKALAMARAVIAKAEGLK